MREKRMRVSCGGTSGATTGLTSAYTFLDKRYVLDDLGNPTDVVDLTNSIYIDWGAFITAILNFFLIALVLFCIIRVMMRAKETAQKSVKDKPTKEERRQLKENGVDMKDRKAVLKATAELREQNKPVEVVKPSTDELLSEILVELKKQNETKQAEIVLEEK